MRDLSLRLMGSSWWHVGFSLVVMCISSCGMQAPECMGSVVCSTRALAEAHKLSSYGPRA